MRTRIEVKGLLLVELDQENGLLVVRRHLLALLKPARPGPVVSFQKLRAPGSGEHAQAPRAETGDEVRDCLALDAHVGRDDVVSDRYGSGYDVEAAGVEERGE